MLAKFFRESALVQAFTDLRSGPERLAASPWATATTPDQIIVAHILHDYAKNGSNWNESGVLPKGLGEKQTSSSYDPTGYKRGDKTTWYRYSTPGFRMNDGKTVVSLVKCLRNQDGDGLAPWFEKSFFEITSVGSTKSPVVLSEAASLQLFKSLESLIVQKKQAEEASAKALAELEENERKWNLAEDLLGMKRNEFGALVPKD